MSSSSEIMTAYDDDSEDFYYTTEDDEHSLHEEDHKYDDLLNYVTVMFGVTEQDHVLVLRTYPFEQQLYARVIRYNNNNNNDTSPPQQTTISAKPELESELTSTVVTPGKRLFSKL